MTPRGGGRYHATTYIGNGKVRSFNNDGEWNLQKRTGIVIKTREITEKAIKLELERQQLITPEKNGRQIIPLPKAQKMMQILYNGRDPRNHTAQMLLQKTDDRLLADIPADNTVVRRFNAVREI